MVAVLTIINATLTDVIRHLFLLEDTQWKTMWKFGEMYVSSCSVFNHIVIQLSFEYKCIFSLLQSIETYTEVKAQC